VERIMNIKKFFLIGLVVLAFIMTIMGVACDGGTDFIFKNNTDQTLTITIKNDYNQELGRKDDVKPGTEVETQAFISPEYVIKARNAEGKLIYSKTFSSRELKDIGWKVVITEGE